MKSSKVVGYVVRWVGRNGRPVDRDSHINDRGCFQHTRHVFATKAETRPVVRVRWPGHKGPGYKGQIKGQVKGCRVFRVVRRSKISSKVVGYVVRIKCGDVLSKEYRDTVSPCASGQIRRVFATKAEAKIVAYVAPYTGEYGWGRVVCRVVRRPKVKPGTAGYVAVDTTDRLEVSKYLGPNFRGWGRRHVFRTREEAESARDHKVRLISYYADKIKIFAVVRRPKA